MTQAIADKLTKALLAAGIFAAGVYKNNSADDCVDDTVDVVGPGIPDGFHLQIGEGYISSQFYNPEVSQNLIVIMTVATLTRESTARAITKLVAAVKAADELKVEA